MKPALLLFLAACASAPHRAALEAQRTGDWDGAAAVWLADLEADTADPVARKRLLAVVPDTVRIRLDAAEAAEIAGHLDDAIAAYDDLFAWAKRLAEVDVDVALDEAVITRRELEDALVQQRYDAGRAAQDARAWLDAVAAFEAARALRPDYADTTARIAACLRAAGAEDVAGKRYRAAIGHYEAAHALVPGPETDGWLAALHAAYGRYYLRQGACRAAYDALSRASEAFDAKLAEDLEAARRCARVEVIVEPFAEPESSADGRAAVLADLVVTGLRAGGSAHLRVLDATSPLPPPGPGARVMVRGRLTRAAVERRSPEDVEKSGVGSTLEVCSAADSTSFDPAVGFVCEKAVPLTWTEHRRALAVDVSASMRVVAHGTGEVLLSAPVDGHVERSVVWVDAVRGPDGAELRLVDAPRPSQVAAAAELRALVGAPSALPPEGPLLSSVLDDLGARAAKAILDTIDHAKPPPEPPWLDVKAPVLDPGQIEFAPAEVPEKPKEEPM